MDAIVPGLVWNSLRDSLYKDQTFKAGWAAGLYAAGQAGRLDPHIHSAFTSGATTGQISKEDEAWFSSRGADETLPVTVGAGQVIPGFEQAIEGMQVGGRRMVTIPSDLGYGPTGQGPIPGDATLVFVLDLVEAV